MKLGSKSKINILAKRIEQMTNLKTGFYNISELKKLKFKSLGKNVLISKSINIVGEENISIGSNVRIDSYTNLICQKGKITIGNYCHIASSCFILGTGGVTMEDFSGIAPGVKIFSSSDNYDGSSLTNPLVGDQFSKPVKKEIFIGKHVIIGTNSVVLPGVKIDEGVAVGALSLVSKSLEKWNIYIGLPIKKLKRRSRDLLDLEKKFLSNENKISKKNK